MKSPTPNDKVTSVEQSSSKIITAIDKTEQNVMVEAARIAKMKQATRTSNIRFDVV